MFRLLTACPKKKNFYYDMANLTFEEKDSEIERDAQAEPQPQM